VQQYLDTLESNLEEGRGAFLCAEAEELYEEIRKEDPSLPQLKMQMMHQSCANMPFAELANIIS